MSMTQSWLCRSDKLVVALRLLLSPVCSGEASMPRILLTVQIRFLRASSNAFSRIINRHHARSVEEYRCDLCLVHFHEIIGLMTCKSVRFGQSAKKSSMSRSTSLIHNIASEGKKEKELTWVLNLIFQCINDDGVGHLSD